LQLQQTRRMRVLSRGHFTITCVFVALLVGFASTAYGQEFDPKQRQMNADKVHAVPPVSAAHAALAASPKSQLWEIHIHHFQYNDGITAKIPSGDWVVWINDDNMQHSATSSSGTVQFDTGLLQPGQRSKPVQFLAETGSGGINYSCLVHDQMQGTLIVIGPVAAAPPPPGPPKETPSTHSFVVVGRESIFLHHIALYHDSNHQYEVTLEATLDDPSARKAYQDYRTKYGDELTVLDPEYFILGELDNGSRTSFKAKFFRQQWTAPIDGLQDVVVRVKRKITFRHFAYSDVYPSRLTYQLVGSSHEAFLIHRITEAPNLQQVIKLDRVPDFLSASGVAASPDLIVVDRQLASDGTYSLKTAVLSNGTHILLGPPPGTLTPNQPTTEGEELTIQMAGDTATHRVKVEKNVYFDVRILNK
jgi:plastocyanin